MDCFFCEPSQALRDNTFYKGIFWDIILHPSGVYLARSSIVLKRHATEEFDLQPDELEESTRLRHGLDKLIREEFGSEKCHYHFAGVEVPHAHWHIIPRYPKDPEIEGHTFADPNRGKNYAPYNRKIIMPEAVRAKVLERLKQKMLKTNHLPHL